MLSDKISKLNPCQAAIMWLDRQDSPQQAWDDCPRGDWMLWIIGKHIKSEPWSDDRKPLLACCLDCAETIKHLWPKNQAERIEEAINTLRVWIVGKASLEVAKKAKTQLYAAATAYAADAAAYAADAAAAAAYAADAADAAAAAAYAADAADAAAYAAAYAAYAADAAYAAADYARKQNRLQTANIVRKYFPISPVL